MNTIHEAKEQKAEELGVYLKPQTCDKLPTYDNNDSQNKWSVNPKMKWLLQNFINQIAGNETTTINSEINSKPIQSKKKEINIEYEPFVGLFD